MEFTLPANMSELVASRLVWMYERQIVVLQELTGLLRCEVTAEAAANLSAAETELVEQLAGIGAAVASLSRHPALGENRSVELQKLQQQTENLREEVAQLQQERMVVASSLASDLGQHVASLQIPARHRSPYAAQTSAGMVDILG